MAKDRILDLLVKIHSEAADERELTKDNSTNEVLWMIEGLAAEALGILRTDGCLCE